jgi:hypothetical protein
MKLFGGVIGWRASKQETVTTSTTEAELLALSQAAKEALFVSRLIKELKIKLDDNHIRIECDNKQTIRLVTEEFATLQTKLRHVDIHNHWLRQEVQNRTISVEYTEREDNGGRLDQGAAEQRFLTLRGAHELEGHTPPVGQERSGSTGAGDDSFR